MEIVHYPHPALRWKSQPIREINRELRKTVKQMLDLMYQAEGVGLAANQVALPLRLFVMNPAGSDKETETEFVFINPEITRRNGSELGEEGCLSLPKLYGDVRRAAEVCVEAYDLAGQPFRLELDDLAARVVQHENDHLDGVLFTDRVSDSQKRELAVRLDDFESIFRRKQEGGEIPSDDQLKQTLRELEPR